MLSRRLPPVFLVCALSSALTLLTACTEKQAPTAPPVAAQALDCNAATPKEAALQILAKKFLEDGLKGYSEGDVQKLLSMTDIKAVEQSDSHVKCKAALAVALSPDLGTKIGQAFSSLEGQADVRNKLEQKFGIIHGSGMFQQINDAISNGPYGVVPAIPTAQQLKQAEETIKKNTLDILAADKKVSFTYEIHREKLPDGSDSTPVKAYVNDLETFDLNVVLLSLGAVL